MSDTHRSGVRSMFDTSNYRKKREGDTVSIRKQKREDQVRKRRQIMTSAYLPAAAPAQAPMPAQAPVAGAPVPVAGAPVAGAPVAVAQPQQMQQPQMQQPQMQQPQMQQPGYYGAQTPVPEAYGAPTPGNTQEGKWEAVLAKQPVAGAESFSSPIELYQCFQSPDPEAHLRATTYIRRLLSIEQSPPIDMVINSGCLPYLVQCLSSDRPKLQFEAAWALTNVASGESKHTRALVENGAAIPLIALLASPSWEICEQAVWALGNIAGDGSALRDQLLQLGVMPQLLAMIQRLLQSDMPRTVVRNAAWTLSNLYRGRPSPDLRLVEPGLPVLKLLLEYPDDEVKVDVIWAVSYATECQNIEKPTPATEIPPVDERIDAVVRADLLSSVYRYLSAPELAKALPAVRTFGNILTGSAKYTDLVLQMNIIAPFVALLDRKNRVIRKEVLWGLSNIAAGTPEQVGALINANILVLANNVIQNSEFDLQKEAGWLVSNAAVCGTPEQVRVMVEKQALVQSLASTLRLPDSRLCRMALSAIETVLGIGAQLGDPNPYVVLMQECRIDDTLYELQNHRSSKIFDKASEIVNDFFDTVEGDELPDDQPGGQPLAPQQPVQFSFGAPQQQFTGRFFQ